MNKTQTKAGMAIFLLHGNARCHHPGHFLPRGLLQEINDFVEVTPIFPAITSLWAQAGGSLRFIPKFY